jgi:hypothetical protein
MAAFARAIKTSGGVEIDVRREDRAVLECRVCHQPIPAGEWYSTLPDQRANEDGARAPQCVRCRPFVLVADPEPEAAVEQPEAEPEPAEDAAETAEHITAIGGGYFDVTFGGKTVRVRGRSDAEDALAELQRNA